MTRETLIKSLSDLISVSLEKWIASHHLSLRSAPLTSALRAPPSKGRRDRYTQNAPHSRPFLWKGLSGAARRGWLPPVCWKCVSPVSLLFPPLSLPHRGRGTAERRSGTFINRRLETLLPALFHTACALSAPSGHLPLEGKATIRKYHLLKKAAKPPREP